MRLTSRTQPAIVLPAVMALSLTFMACGNGNGEPPADPVTAVSYLNPDTGAATANADVSANSECETPDQDDDQQMSPAGSATRNVHNDACLFRNGVRFDAQATFESSGAGLISACPDPDGTGPKTAALTDTNGDGRADRCTVSGFQTTGADGDNEYHARMNNNDAAGTQTVVFCPDANGNGCADEAEKDTIVIRWTP